MKKSTFRLTKKTTRQLLKRELGFAGELSVTCAESKVYIYEMHMASFTVTVENDWLCGDGLIRLTLHSGAQSIHLFYNPITLEQDIEAEEKYLRLIRKELLEIATKQELI